MKVSLRTVSRALGSIPPLFGWVGAALGGIVDEVDAAPLAPPPLVQFPGPQTELVNLVALLFAVSLSMLAYGYLFDGPFSAPSPGDENG